MVNGKLLFGVDDPMQVRLHQIGNDVDIVVIFSTRGLQQISDLDDIVMMEVFYC